MKRIEVKGRSLEEMKKDFNRIGFNYYDIPSLDGSDYWRENVAFQFDQKEIDLMKNAAEEVHQMSMDYVDEVIRTGDVEQYEFSEEVTSLIEQTYLHSKRIKFADSFYGRFDFGYDGKDLKLIEYNADTPTSLLEAGLAQRTWLEHQNKNNNNNNHLKQFNHLTEDLEKALRRYYKPNMNLCLVAENYPNENKEDFGNIYMIADILHKIDPKFTYKNVMSILDVGYDPIQQQFVDLKDEPIDGIFKLYPWEYMVEEEFFKYLDFDKTSFVEPIWKMLLSNKILLVELWDRHKNHPLLLEASYLRMNKPHVKKAILAREGANVFLKDNEDDYKKPLQFVDLYDRSGYIYQELYNMPNFDGYFPIMGLWMIGNKCSSLGIREDLNKVTSNDSHFVPHFIL